MFAAGTLASLAPQEEPSTSWVPPFVRITTKDGECQNEYLWTAALDPTLTVNITDDFEDHAFVEKHYPDFMESVYQRVTHPVERADIWRYMVVHHYGGIYADCDVQPQVSPRDWASRFGWTEGRDGFNATNLLVTGIELPLGHVLEVDEVIGYYPPLQIVQWTFASSRPRHPALLAVLDEVKQRVDLQLKGTDQEGTGIIDRTGPHAWTAGLLKYILDHGVGGANMSALLGLAPLEEQDKRGQLFRLRDPQDAEEWQILLLPYRAFGFHPAHDLLGSMGNVSGADDGQRLVRHLFQGTWKSPTLQGARHGAAAAARVAEWQRRADQSGSVRQQQRRPQSLQPESVDASSPEPTHRGNATRANGRLNDATEQWRWPWDPPTPEQQAAAQPVLQPAPQPESSPSPSPSPGTSPSPLVSAGTAEPRAEFSAAAFAWTLANDGMVTPQFTCAVDRIADTCPGLEPLESMCTDMDWPAANAKWLFYGPSFMYQAFQAVVARATFVSDIVGVEDALAPYRESVPACPGVGTEREGRFETLDVAEPGDVACNWAHARDDVCHGAPAASNGARITFANGAEIWGMNNVPQLQVENRSAAMRALDDFMEGKAFDLIFYMAPHGEMYFREHCAADAQGRPMDPTNFWHGDDDMCIRPALDAGSGPWFTSPTTAEEYAECVDERKSWKIIKRHAREHGSRLVKVAPWKVNPEGRESAETFYVSFPAAWKYPCGAVASNGSAGVGAGPCTVHGLKRGAAMDEFKMAHPCTVVCEASTGRCVLGASALMATEMVERALGAPQREDYAGFLSYDERVAGTCSGESGRG